jgi:hypothetical protein
VATAKAEFESIPKVARVRAIAASNGPKFAKERGKEIAKFSHNITKRQLEKVSETP